MTPEQEKCILKHIQHLQLRTTNLKLLVTELLQHGVITLAEREEIMGKPEVEIKSKFLYEIILKKSAICFTLLLKCLRSSGNTSIAVLLEETFGEIRKGRTIYRRSSSTTDRYVKEEIGNTLIKGREFGIAEILEENPTFSSNWKLIFYLLNASDGRIPFLDKFGSFAVKATIMLRDWTEQQKENGTLFLFMEVLEKKGHLNTAIRIKRMFEDFNVELESGFLFEFQRAASTPSNTDTFNSPIFNEFIHVVHTVNEEESEIAKVLEDNPDFALKWEKLFLLLQLPVEYFQQFLNHQTFIDKATKMLSLWKDFQEDKATYFQLSKLLVQNGHRSTAGKIIVLSTM